MAVVRAHRPKVARFRAPAAGIEHRNWRIVGKEMVGSEDILAQPLVQGFEPPAGAADPAGQRRTRKIDAVPGKDLRLTIERRVIAILVISTCASSAGVATPPAIGRSGAGAWAIDPQARQAYFGRAIRMTRSCAGTQSSISLTLSPMEWSLAPQHAHARLSTSSRTSSRDR